MRDMAVGLLEREAAKSQISPIPGFCRTVDPDIMSWDDQEPYEPEAPDEEQGPGPHDDPSVQELEPLLMALFEARPDAVFYKNQLCVLF